MWRSFVLVARHAFIDLSPTIMLNDLAWDLVQQLMLGEEDLRVDIHNFDGGGAVIDCGIETVGSLSAGLALAEICTAGLAELSIHPGTIGDIGWPQVFVQSDNPVEACLLSQYAGWSIQVKDFFGMGSGPMRARAGKEEIFKELEFDDSDSDFVVGILETGDLPGSDVIGYIAETCKIDPAQVCLLAAPTSSLAGNLQVVARSLETAMHKLHVLGFDVSRVEAGCGCGSIVSGGGRRFDRHRPHERRHPLWRSRDVVDGWRRRFDRRDRPADPIERIEYVWPAVPRSLPGCGRRLLSDRSEPFQPGRGLDSQHRDRQGASLRRLE